MRCQECDRLLNLRDPIYRVTVGYNTVYYSRWRCSVGSLCAECGSEFNNQRWRQPEPCRNCGRPVTLSGRRQKPTYVVCGEKCRNAVYHVTSTRYLKHSGRKEAVCETCRRKFDSMRVSARYCSSACRQSAYRARTRRQEEGSMESLSDDRRD